MLVSFIIPSYNSAHTIKRCLDSIYALSLKPTEFEVIFVDDCSADNTCQIVAEYQVQHPNITLLRQPKNNRQGAARNRGVAIAKGVYICFVDSDDAVTEGIVTAIRSAERYQTDMTAYHYGSADENGEIPQEAARLSFEEGLLFSGIEMQNNHDYWWCSAPWGYIYKKDFMQNVNYPFAEGVLYEDSDYVAVHLYHARRMAYSAELGYIAYYRAGSTTRSMSYKNLADYFFLGLRMMAFYSFIQEDISQNKRTDIGIRDYAKRGILEGAIHNITMSLKRLYKLNGIKEIIRYYKRIDNLVSRVELYNDPRIHTYPNYWNTQAVLGIKHKYFSIFLNSCLSVAYKLYKNLKNKR